MLESFSIVEFGYVLCALLILFGISGLVSAFKGGKK